MTDLDEFAGERRIQTGADIGNSGSPGIYRLNGGDVLWFQAQNTNAATGFTIKHANISIHKL
jgi:hypothetical protein